MSYFKQRSFNGKRQLRTDFRTPLFTAKQAEKEEEDCGWLGKLGAAALGLGGAAAASVEGRKNDHQVAIRGGSADLATTRALDAAPDASANTPFALPFNNDSDLAFAKEDSGGINALPSSTFDAEAYSMFDENEIDVLQNTQFPPPLKPLGVGISNFVYEVPEIHPMHAELAEELDVPESSKIAIKVTYDYDRSEHRYSAKNSAKTFELKFWGQEHGVIPRERIVPGSIRRSFFPATQNKEQKEKLQELWTRMKINNVASPLSAPDDRGNFMPTFLPPEYNHKRGDKRKYPMVAVEVVTPVEAMAKQFNALVEETTGSKGGSFMKRVPKSELWSAVFRNLIEDKWYKYMFDVMDELNIIPDDNHAMNFGLRLRDDWKERAQQFMTSYQDAFDSTEVASLTEIETEEEFNDLKQKFKPFKDGLLDAVLEENVQQYRYGPLVATDVDHFFKNDGYFETQLGYEEEDVKRRGESLTKYEMKERTLNTILGSPRPWNV